MRASSAMISTAAWLVSGDGKGRCGSVVMATKVSPPPCSIKGLKLNKDREIKLMHCTILRTIPLLAIHFMLDLGLDS